MMSWLVCFSGSGSGGFISVVVLFSLYRTFAYILYIIICGFVFMGFLCV